MEPINRRRFLAMTAAAGTLAACRGGTESNSGASAASSTDTTPTTAMKPAEDPSAGPAAQRRLVVIEMAGGNDGMSTLVPYGMAGYRDLRSRTAIETDKLVRLNDTYGVPKTLKGLSSAGLAILMGVGAANPDGSHFEMLERWWRGDTTGSGSVSTGFLGRIADAIGDPSARATAISIGAASHPALISRSAATMSLPRADIGELLATADPDDKIRTAFQAALRELGVGADATALGVARRGTTDALRFAQTLAALDEEKTDNYPGSSLGQGLKLAARLLQADNGVRIVHVPMNVDFDTHDDHPGRHMEMMTELNDAAIAFLADLKKRKLDSNVLVMTISEFGRKAQDNGSTGLDHGAASVALLAGPVKRGVHGEHSPLDRLDDDGNLIATVGFDRYYATVAEHWFGVPASEVLPGNVKPLDGIIKV